MDETKQQSREAATISPFKVPSSEKPGLFANAPRDSPNIHLGTQDPNLPAHCQGWGMGFNFNRARRRAHDMTDSTSGSAPEVDGDQPSACFTTFAGVTLDQALPGQLSAFHILGDDGDAETESDEWNAMANEVGGPEVISPPSFQYPHPLTFIETAISRPNWPGSYPHQSPKCPSAGT